MWRLCCALIAKARTTASGIKLYLRCTSLRCTSLPLFVTRRNQFRTSTARTGDEVVPGSGCPVPESPASDTASAVSQRLHEGADASRAIAMVGGVGGRGPRLCNTRYGYL